MKLQKFCPACGKETNSLIKGFCIDCFLEKNSFFEIPEIILDVCKRCPKVKFGLKEENYSDERLIKFVKSKIKIKQLDNPIIFLDLVEKKEDSFLMHVKISGELDGKKISLEKDFEIMIHLFTCDSCMRVSGGYHEAIIQIRWKEDYHKIKNGSKRQAEIIAEITSLLESQQNDALARIVRIEEKKEGSNILIGSKKSALKAITAFAKKYDLKIITTSKFISRTKDGFNQRRFTYLVRV